MKYLWWLLSFPLGIIILVIQFSFGDPVSDNLIILISNNQATSFVGIKGVLTITLFLWQISGFVSTITGVVLPIRGFVRSRSQFDD